MNNANRRTLNEWRDAIHALAVEKGGWPEENEYHATVHVALVHAEVSEVLEVLRAAGDLDREHLAEELGDAIGRLLDIAGAFGLDIDGALEAKHAKNKLRAFRHGKRF